MDLREGQGGLQASSAASVVPCCSATCKAYMGGSHARNRESGITSPFVVTGRHPRGSATCLSCESGMRVLQEETQHLACGVGPVRVGVGAGRAAAEPGVPRTVYGPLLDHRPPGRVRAQRAAVSVAAGTRPCSVCWLSAAAWAACATTASALQGFTVLSRSPWKTIAGTMRSPTPDPRGRGAGRAIPLHGREHRRHVAGRPAGEARVHPDRGEEVGVGPFRASSSLPSTSNFTKSTCVPGSISSSNATTSINAADRPRNRA
jgi:hypothetical protein